MTQLGKKFLDRTLFHLQTGDRTFSFPRDNDANLCIDVALAGVDNQPDVALLVEPNFIPAAQSLFAINPCDGDPAPVFVSEIVVSNEKRPILYDWLKWTMHVLRRR
jgi:hypothetical protein